MSLKSLIACVSFHGKLSTSLVLLLCLSFVCVWRHGWRATAQTDDGPPTTSKTTQPYAVPGQLLVRFISEGEARWQESALTEIAAAPGTLALRVENFQGAAIVPGLRLVRVSEVETGAALEALNKLSNVRYAEPNYLRYAFATPNDAHFNEMWGLKNTGQAGGQMGYDIRAEQAWDTTTGSRAVVVGVVDEGIDMPSRLASQHLAKPRRNAQQWPRRRRQWLR